MRFLPRNSCLWNALCLKNLCQILMQISESLELVGQPLHPQCDTVMHVDEMMSNPFRINDVDWHCPPSMIFFSNFSFPVTSKS